MGKSVLKELKEFLDYLSENYNSKEKREHGVLKKWLGKENFDKLEDICFENGYITNERANEDRKNPEYATKITKKGLKFIEEYSGELKKDRIATINLITTIILVLITAYYAYQTYNLNSNQFESENMPLLIPEGLTIQRNTENNNTLLKYNFNVTNFGKGSGRIMNVSFYISDSKESFSLDKFKQRTILRENEKSTIGPISFLETPNNKIAKTNIEVTLYYSGVGKLSKKIYMYKEIWEIDKTSNEPSVKILEGKI